MPIYSILNRIANVLLKRNHHMDGEAVITDTPGTQPSIITGGIDMQDQQQKHSYIWPVEAGRPAITQGFHDRHGGIDIQNQNNVQGHPSWSPLPASGDTPSGSSAANTGNPVRAVMDGVVSFRIVENASAGNGFVIAHGGGYFSKYLHLHSRDFEALPTGTSVTQGQRLGLTGQSGQVFSSGHLHFEIIFVEGRDEFSAEQDAEFFSLAWFSNNRTGSERNHVFWKHNPRHYLPDVWVWTGNFTRGHDSLRN